jgi:hypothetical protein
MNATVSIGVAESFADVASIPNLLARADRALYAAKAAGRNCVCTERGAGIAPLEAPPTVPKGAPAQAACETSAAVVPAMS